ncbi:hypothetical protein FJZ19_02475 [Candidatus Pacearchaeota archaeon]|nr:hypothetical protein [Candidatus Pacearchaeota archaeon]
MFGISWIIIALLLVLLLFLAKARHIKHKSYAIIIVFLLLFLYISASQIFSGANIDFKSFDGWIKAGKLYFSWLVHIGGNVKDLAGNAIKMDWVGNSTGK